MTNEERIKAMNTRSLARELAAVAGYNGNPEEVAFWENWLKKETDKRQRMETNTIIICDR